MVTGRDNIFWFEEMSYYKNMGAIQREMIDFLLQSLSKRDDYDFEHSFRVGQCAYDICRMMDLSEMKSEEIAIAGLLHDVGKIRIPKDILQSTEKLTDKEYLIIQSHPYIGCEILKSFEFSDTILNGVLLHHKRYDLKGYPHDIAVEKLPIEASIIGVADAFDAMVSNRPYKKAFSLEKTIEELIKYKGSQFDPDIIDVFVGALQENISKLMVSV